MQNNEDDFSWDRPEETMGGPDGEEALSRSFRDVQIQQHRQPHRGGYEPEVINFDEPQSQGEYGYEEEPQYGDDQAVYDLDRAEKNTLNEATLRFEQANLYRMLLQHNLFGDVDADPTAVANVQRELKEFLMGRLEVLLGMKSDEYGGAMNFTSIEVKALKQVAQKITDGYTKKEPIFQDRQPTTSNAVKPLTSNKPAIKPLVNNKPKVEVSRQPAPRPAPTAQPAQRPAQRPVQQTQAPQKPLSKAPINPQNKVKSANAPIRPRIEDEGKLKKHPTEMNEDELIARNKLTAERTSRPALPRNGSPLPQPNADQMAAVYGAQQSEHKLKGLASFVINSKK